MGKKTKKTKWRTLEISLPVAGKNYHENSANVQWDDGWRFPSHKYRRNASVKCDKVDINIENHSCEESRARTLIEEEYTKITTPRQDVLFKKGYLTKRKTSRHNIGGENMTVGHDAIDSASVINVCITQQDCAGNGEEEFCDYAIAETNGDECLLSQSPVQPQEQLLCAAVAQPYLDASSAAAAMYYGGGYEIYDPYTGNVTALVVGTASSSGNGATATAAACQPILASMPCRPVPLQSLQWFSPVPVPVPVPVSVPVPSSSEWCCGGAFATQKTDVNSPSSGSCSIGVAAAVDTDLNVAQPPYFNDSTNVDPSSVESSCPAENTTTAPTIGNGDGDSIGDCPPYLRLPQAYAYSGCVFATSVHDEENDGGEIRCDSPEFPVLGANQSAATKRKKKKKRRRRLGDTGNDSESGVEENPNECVTSSECVFAYARDDDDDDDDSVSGSVMAQRERNTLHGWQTKYQHRLKCAATLPRTSVNAPPFIPCDRAFARELQTPLPLADPESVSCSSRGSGFSENYLDNVGFEKASAVAAANVVSSARRISSADNGNNKSLTDSPSSCSNSDSGISSPANEECSSIVVERQDFRKFAKADRSKAADANTHVNENDNGNDNVGNSLSATAAVDNGMVGVNAPFNVNVSGGRARSNSVGAVNSDQRDTDKVPKKVGMKNRTSVRVVAVAKRCRSKNKECDGGDDDAAAAAQLEGFSTAAVAGGAQMNRGRDAQPPQSGRKRNASFADCSKYEGETVGSNARRDDDLDPSKTSSVSGNAIWNIELIDAKSEASAKTSARPTCDGQPAHVDENDSPRLDSGQVSAQSANRNAKLEPRWLRSISTTTSSPRQSNGNADVDANGNVDVVENGSDDAHALTTSRSAGRRDSVSSSPPSSASNVAAMSRFPSDRRDESRASRESIGSMARALLDELVEQAELEIRARTTPAETKKCDKTRLPLTQAVTNWLNEHGGLAPAVRDPSDHRRRILTRRLVNGPSDSCTTHELRERESCSNTRNSLKNPKTRSNCVIC